MQRINTPDGAFHAGDDSTGALGTIVTSAYMQSMQEEVVGVVEGAGMELDPADNGQLLKALVKIIKMQEVVSSYSIAALPTQNVGPILVTEVAEIWTWSASAHFTGYRSQLCGDPLFSARATPLIQHLDAVGGSVSMAAYPGLWGWAQDQGLVVTAANWVAGTHTFVDNGNSTFRLPDLRNQFFRATGTNADTANARAIGSGQAHGIAKHQHEIWATGKYSNTVVGSGGGVAPYAQGTLTGYSTGDGSAQGLLTETRPTNTAYAARIHI